MTDETRKTKERGPNFPFISLSAALQRADQFYNKEKRGSAPFPVVAAHWNFSPLSSGAIQTAAALKSYGLMADEGTGSAKKLRLTDLALRILLDQRPDSQERMAFVRQAVVNPPVIAEIIQKFPDELPSDANLNHYLVLDRGFNQATALKAIEILKQNQMFAGVPGNSTILGQSKIESEADQPQAVPMNMLDASSIQPKGGGAVQVAIRSDQKVERIIAPDADVLLQFQGNPTWETYDFLEKYVTLRKSVLKKAGPQ